jgi:hypothetical protein
MLLGGAGPEVTVPAALICLAPNLLALGVTELVRTRSQTAQTGVLLASFLVRPLVAIGLGVATYYLLPHLHGRALALLLWGALFYLILLVAESVVISRRVGSSNEAKDPLSVLDDPFIESADSYHISIFPTAGVEFHLPSWFSKYMVLETIAAIIVLLIFIPACRRIAKGRMAALIHPR